MEVTNASGQKVSLLNGEHPTHFSYPRPKSHSYSRKSSCSTQMSRDESDSPLTSRKPSPTFSATATPQLSRFDSTSSQGTLNTPSPMTPNYTLEPMDQTKTVAPSRDTYYRPSEPYYAPMPQMQDATSQPYYNLALRQANDLLMDEAYPPLNESQLQTHFAFPSSELVTPISPRSSLQTPITAIPASTSQATSTAATSSNPKLSTKKKYPCPHAQIYSCIDTFTTSGHAARHGKKHTGEKNIHCPTCDKAFTRKDNMKQHERTHKTGSDSSSSSKAPTVATAASSNSLVSSESRENHNASRKRIKTARSNSTTVAPLSLVPKTSTETADGDAEDDEAEYQADTSDRPHRRRPGLTESLRYSTLSIDTRLAERSRPTLDRTITDDSQDGEGESPGLDALAMAASGMSS